VICCAFLVGFAHGKIPKFNFQATLLRAEMVLQISY
jgi:hypothetical protein